MDIFYEQFITKDYSKEIKKFESIKLALVILIIFNSILRISSLAILFILAYIFVLLLTRKKIIEFEYELIGNELIISKIINKRSRKKIVEINLENVVEIVSLEKFNRKEIKVINSTLDVLNKEVEENVIIIRNNSNLIGYKVSLDKKIQNILKNININMFK